jgi:uncharacterized delta-60 repeat protein
MSKTRRCAAALASAAVLLTGAAGAAHAAPGDPDQSFGGDGRKTFDAGGYDAAEAVLVQPDGKLVVAGGAGDDFAVTRLNPDGSADTTFAVGGTRTVDLGAVDYASAVARQPDGKIVVAGSSFRNGDDDAVVVRLNADGALDDTFDGDGTKRFGTSTQDAARAVVVQPNGRIVVAGGAGGDLAVWRLNPDGSFDTAFDGDGASQADFGADDFAWAAALQPNGRIVVAGYTSDNGNFAVARFNLGGSLDATFSFDGKNTVNFGAADLANAVLVQPNGRIVLAGFTWSDHGAAVARLNAHGSLDPTFDGDGRTTFGDADSAWAVYDVLAQPDGKLVTAGSGTGGLTVSRLNADGSLDTGFAGDGTAAVAGFSLGKGAALQTDGRIVAVGWAGSDSAVARVLPDGSLDETFGGEGGRSFGFGGYEVARGVVAQPDGRIVAAGVADGDFLVTRLLAHGSPDATFGQGGTRKLDFGGYWDEATAIARQADGRLVVAGHTFTDGGNGLAVGRLTANGTPDATFDGDGLRMLDFPGYDYAYAVLVQPDGRIVLAGQGGEGSDFAITRLNADGSLDTSFGDGGRVTVDLGAWDVAMAVARQADGGLVLAGQTSAGSDVAVVRLTAGGAPDPTFDGDGRKTFGYAGDDAARAVMVQPDGRIVVAGYGGPDTTLAVTRLGPDGAFDTTFDQDGSRGVDFGGYEFGTGAVLQRNGRIVVAGHTSTGGGDTAVARLNPDGTPDTTFSLDGRATFDHAGGLDQANAIALQPNGRLVLAGEVNSDVAVARLIGDVPR